MLAVIVVLAVIALIATPLVMNAIEDARKGSLERSYDHIEDSASNYVYANYNELNIPDYVDYYLPVQELTDNGYLKNATEEMNQEYVIVKKSDDDMTFYYTGRDQNPYETNGTLKENIESDTSHIVKNVVINGVTVNKVIGTKSEKDTTMKNYVWYSGNLWQVLETTDEYVKMVLAHSITSIPYGETSDWNNTYDGRVTAYVGLPSYGERYSGNDLNVAYWYMNRWVNSSSDVGHVNTNGGAAGLNTGVHWYGVRPVLHLNSNLYIISGNGTSNQPYQVSL